MTLLYNSIKKNIKKTKSIIEDTNNLILENSIISKMDLMMEKIDNLEKTNLILLKILNDSFDNRLEYDNYEI